ncbi:hypothetical protein IFM89_019954 [Coptis chinensis]|uniref:C2H2-type domain-containing protein n=1 Tax=Coptis chinensis TaxID=261450 RepID=A0A835HCZ0_9MAGN|nr:hypothetical protein IFM89_019954 [Coptis chinensis]
METEPPCLEKSDQKSLTTDDDEGPTYVRSYECTFCKRGFSNAQALGGHMNIHRKDRAKLKQPSNHNKFTFLNITKKNLSYPSISSIENKSEKEYTENRWPWIIPEEEDDVAKGESNVGELRQLQLFVESPSSSEDRKLKRRGGCEERMTQLSHGSGKMDLDLELRLGPEPLDRNTIGTIEFF